MRLRYFMAAGAMLTASLIARADVVLPGSYGGGTAIDSTGKTIAGTSISYTDAVYADAGNPFCAGCYDFVITIQDPGISYGVLDVNTTGFAGYSLAYAYEDDGNVAPTSASANKAGNKVTFDISLLNDNSDPLIIYTNAKGYTSGGLTIDDEETDPPAFAPDGPAVAAATPEPSSLLLFGTGVLGAVGAMRKRFA